MFISINDVFIYAIKFLLNHRAISVTGLTVTMVPDLVSSIGFMERTRTFVRKC